MNVQLKLVPTCHALKAYIHNLCDYPACSAYVHAPRELKLWTHGGRGGGGVGHIHDWSKKLLL